MAALNAAAPQHHRPAVRRRAPSTSRPSAAHLDALGVAVPPRAGPRPRPRLLHADRVRVLRRRPRGPAAGARRRRPLRRPRRAARRPADAGHRLRDRARPAPPRARRAGRARRRRSRPPVAVVVGADPDDTVDAPADRHGPAGGRASRPAPSSAAASSASSSRRRPATRPTSRSSSATSWRPARSSCATCAAGTQKLVALADLAREIERSHGSHRHGATPD